MSVHRVVHPLQSPWMDGQVSHFSCPLSPGLVQQIGFCVGAVLMKREERVVNVLWRVKRWCSRAAFDLLTAALRVGKGKVYVDVMFFTTQFSSSACDSAIWKDLSKNAKYADLIPSQWCYFMLLLALHRFLYNVAIFYYHTGPRIKQTLLKQLLCQKNTAEWCTCFTVNSRLIIPRATVIWFHAAIFKNASQWVFLGLSRWSSSSSRKCSVCINSIT